MKKAILSIVVLLSSLWSSSQSDDNFYIPFNPLEIVDSVPTSKLKSYFSEVTTIDSLNSFVASGFKDQNGYFFVQKKGQSWRVYNLDDALPNAQDFHIENKRFITLTRTQGNSGGSSRNHWSWLNTETAIIDRINLTYRDNFYTEYTMESSNPIPDSTSEEMWTQFENGEIDIEFNHEENSCNSTLTFKKDCLVIRKESFTDTTGIQEELCDVTISSGDFLYFKKGFRKIRQYSENQQKFLPLHWVGNICPGIALTVLNQDYLDCNTNTVSAIPYGFDCEGKGLEVVKEKEVLFFVTTSDTTESAHIKTITVVSPRYKIDKLHTGLTISEMLKLYPGSKLQLGSYGWEYIFLRKQNFKAIFKTNDTNRIGNYDLSSGDPVCKSIKRPDAKIDLIELSKDW